MRAAADGPFFPDCEFSTLFGLKRGEVRRIADEWPLPTVPPEDVVLAINSSMNWLLSYPHRKHELWSECQSGFNELFNKLRRKKNETPFDRMM
ncbi:MAG TPA: hypothetical protein VLJ39_02400 [Tepidisphaeraceae bacterium]|nr:hypothetical protein [Tepidisphaeraceae bacterium]